jgi:4'-phosphopantetheinyl transferase EntD
MPLHKIEWTSHRCGWALWNITETEDVLVAMAHPEVCPNDIHSPSKRLEWLAGRILLKQLLARDGLAYHGLHKDTFGKPFLDGYPHPISLSHSYPYVAAQIDLQHAVGIDVEQPKDKLLRVAHRVLDRAEEEDAGKDITKNCIYWCAKEALYKIYGQRGLTFSKHLRIQPFVLSRSGHLIGKISAPGADRLINLGYLVEKDFVLVYTRPK